MENNHEEIKLKIEKINKYKKEKNVYNAIKIIASIFAGLGMIVNSYILYVGIKRNGEDGSIVSVLAGLLGFTTLWILGKKLNIESNKVNKEYNEKISMLEEETKVR